MEKMTYIAQALETSSALNALYDSNIKTILADKQVLTRILKYTLDEFAHMQLYEIEQCIDPNIEIGTIPVDPGYTNLKKAPLQNTEDAVPGEGTIFFDIRFTVNLPQGSIRIIVNLEAQNITRTRALGYPLAYRTVYYLSRLISSQKTVEFTGTNYGDIKKVVSIWICMTEREDSIKEIYLADRMIFGERSVVETPDLLRGIFIQLRCNRTVDESKNKLIAMLEDLLNQDSLPVKKEKLQSKHGIIMSVKTEGGIQEVCNLSTVIEDNALARGLAQGLEQGLERGRLDAISAYLSNEGVTDEDAKKYLHASDAEIEQARKLITV